MRAESGKREERDEGDQQEEKIEVKVEADEEDEFV